MASRGNTVSVACKLPNGVRLHLDDMIDRDEPVMGGGVKTVKRAFKRPQEVVLYGVAVPFGQAPKCLLAGGFAITPNVPADFMAAWLEQNKDSDLVKSGLIKIHAKQSYIEGYAKEHAALKSGLEPEDPKAPRMTRIKPSTAEAATA